MKRFAGLFLIVALVAVLWGGGWFFVASQVQQELGNLASNDGSAANPRVTCASSGVGGFPFRIDVTCEDATITADDLTVTVAGIRASAQVDNPSHVLVSLKSPVTSADAFYGSSSRFEFDSLQGSFRATTDDILKGLSGEGWRIARVAVVGDNLDWVDTVAGDLPRARASHAELQIGDIPELHDPAAGTAALAVYAFARDVAAPGYGVSDGDAEVQLQVTGLPDDLRRFADADLLPAWQAAGGKLDVVQISGTDGEDMLDASGSLGLNANRQVEGEITYTNRGVRERLAAFVNPMLLSVLSGLPQPDGSFKQALQFANGALLVAGIPLFQLEALY